MCVLVANPADCSEVVGDTSAAAMGLQPAHEYCGPVCAPAGSLGGGEDGPLSPDLGAGTIHILSDSKMLKSYGQKLSYKY